VFVKHENNLIFKTVFQKIVEITLLTIFILILFFYRGNKVLIRVRNNIIQAFFFNNKVLALGRGYI